jgi:hypothetical protein
MLHIYCAYLVAQCQVVGKYLLLNVQMFVLKILKSVKQKVRAGDNWYWLMLQIFEMFDFCARWWYVKFFIMGVIGITF